MLGMIINASPLKRVLSSDIYAFENILPWCCACEVVRAAGGSNQPSQVTVRS